MQYRTCILLFIMGLLVGCMPIEDQHSSVNISSLSTVSESFQSGQSIYDLPNTNSVDDTEVPLQESDEVVIKEIDKSELLISINEVIETYNDGTIVVSDRIQPLPSYFTFPKDISEESINVDYSEVMGEHKVTISSVNNKWTATFFSNNFIYVDFDGNTSGGEFIVTDVVFTEK